MQVVFLFISAWLITCALGQAPEVSSKKRPSEPQRVTSDKYRFSVALPRGWFVLKTGDLPVFISYPPEEALPQWQLPPGGAMIEMCLCPVGGAHPTGPTPYSCTEHQFAVEHAAVIDMQEVPGPPALGLVRAVLTSGEQVQLGTPSVKLHIITAFWRYGDQIFGAELSYTKRNLWNQYKRTLLDVIQNFQPK